MNDSLTSFAQWTEWKSEGYTRVPYILRDQLNQLPESWLQAWQEASPYAFVLESGKEGRYTFLGLEAESVLRGIGEDAEIIEDLNSQVPSSTKSTGDPLEVIRRWMEPYQAPRVENAPKFVGGAVGYLSYDVARSLEKLPNLAKNDLAQAGLPDYAFMRLRQLWVIDHAEQQIYVCVSVPIDPSTPSLLDDSYVADAYKQAKQEAQQMLERWRALEQSTLPWNPEHRAHVVSEAEQQMSGRNDVDGFDTSFSQEAFQNAVERIQEYIRSGDVFQVNLSLRKQRKLQASPEQIYEWMRLVNPSPYMGFLRFPDFQLVSGSPELLVRLENGRLAARPIAGTRRRGATEEEDARMAEELTGNEKEKAEHIMLVDLQRNDLGRVAAYGSVHVPELMTIERYAHVMHLVSQVEAKLAPGKNAYDVIAGVFPGGTITGAPKVRTMQIVEELEPVRRGPYTGSMGWIDYSGNMELNIIIRTLVVQDGIGHMQAGAGIVIDSEPYREYRECHNKARSVGRAVWCAEYAASEGGAMS
ncbi:anthranilate synthase component I family protein [Saccharibacillus sp. JS10]|uniref:anthranilate synthase component I family protein n=1 Tax=Saccharibacillus sp. JS10 TaxID=2950552 RepID=UPI00210B42D2|nr:anthranilate synthase component I family protein [Saccharibacillus sp. JS10]MCQ4088974.1 anthranilate synthase component I family protein [Saccharibacillus sp. JS10]